MNKRKVVILSIVLIVVLILSWSIYFIFTKQDKKSTLTIMEKKWIENNKNNVVDMGMINGIPIFNYDGEGVIFDFINKLEKDTSLEFNKISYDLGQDNDFEYSFSVTDDVKENSLLIYEDNFGIISKDNKSYKDLKDIPEMVLGVTNADLKTINFYLDNDKLTYKTYDTEEELFKGLVESNEIDAIVVPKTIYLKEISTNELYINYNITDASKKIVLNLGNNKKLNIIIKKYYKKWKNKNYDKSYNKYFLDDYFVFNNIYEESVAEFRGKTYNYGFINYAPYNSLVNGKLVGISNEYMKKFSKMAGIEIKYKQYKSTKELVQSFNENKIDFFLNTSNNKKYNIETMNTSSVFDSNINIISNIDNNISINSLASLKGKDVYVLENSKISDYLKNYDIILKEINNYNTLLNKIDSNSIVAMDNKTFDMYRHDKLNQYKIDYSFDLDDHYMYTIRDIKTNKIFENFFNFYLSFIDNKKIENTVTYNMFIPTIKNTIKNNLLVIIFGLIVLITLIIVIIKKPFEKKQKEVFKKDSKIKYMDMLTSLKNRNYLNDSMVKWDESEIYPQSIIIVDLNNIAYINDNYGHEEGDKVIKQAANILITTQIENSEIMRTNGNEFLIYLVEYEEKQIVTYIRKLSKEFRELDHGFGAAIGYSMINDAIKTIDDAINEATLDMKSNKEEINN